MCCRIAFFCIVYELFFVTVTSLKAESHIKETYSVIISLKTPIMLDSEAASDCLIGGNY